MEQHPTPVGAVVLRVVLLATRGLGKFKRPFQRVISRSAERNTDRGSLPFEQNGPKEDIDDLRVVVRICPL